MHVTLFSECAVTVTKPFGVVTSPGYPQPYQNGIDCTWRIQLSVGQLIQFNFLHFDVDHDVQVSYLGCMWDSSAASEIFPKLINVWVLPHWWNSFDFRHWDSLTIYDGGSNTSPMLAKPYCGVTLPPSQLSSSNHLFFHFHSSAVNTGTGFKFEYNATSKNS